MRPAIRPQISLLDLIYPAVDCVCVGASLWFLNYCAYAYVNERSILLGLVAMLIFLFVGQSSGQYGRWKASTPGNEVLQVGVLWGVTVLFMAVLSFLTRYEDHFARSLISVWIIMAPACIGLARMLIRLLRRSLQHQGVGYRRVAIVGCNSLGQQVAQGIQDNEETGLKLVGMYDGRDPERLKNRESFESYRGDYQALVRGAQQREIDLVLITLPMRAENRIRDLLDQLSDTTASVYIVPDVFVFELLHSRWSQVAGLPAVSVFETPFYGVDGILKRVSDIVLAMLALIVAALPMLAIAILVKLTSRGPVLFGQRRYGLDGQEIRVWKFRSMSVCEDGPQVKQATQQDRRVTPLGKVLRRTSLDELPQLFNVIEGTMSLVGPRPHATAHNEQYRRLIRGYMLRHKVKPGITGLAQVEGCRGETDTVDKMRRRVEYDHRYIRDWSVLLDVKILFKTLLVAWRQPEAY